MCHTDACPVRGILLLILLPLRPLQGEFRNPTGAVYGRKGRDEGRHSRNTRVTVLGAVWEYQICVLLLVLAFVGIRIHTRYSRIPTLYR